MPRLSFSIRGLLATGLIVSALLCCCQGESLGRVIARLAETGSVFAQAEGMSCCAKAESKTDSMPTDDGRPCDCQSRAKATSMPDAKPAVEFTDARMLAPILVSWVGPRTPSLVSPDTFPGEVFAQPPTSLLRQHCALMI